MDPMGIGPVGRIVPNAVVFFYGNTDFSIESGFSHISLHEDFLWYRKTSKNKQRN